MAFVSAVSERSLVRSTIFDRLSNQNAAYIFPSINEANYSQQT